jgi:glycosyltransferase involved in cell wall biosynthesis
VALNPEFKQKQTLHYVNNSPSPYMADLFRALTKVPELDLHVHHVLSSPPGRPWQISLTDGYCERSFRTRMGLDWHLIRTVLSEKDSFLFSASWGDLTNQVCIAIAAALGRRYAVWNDAPNFVRRRNPIKAEIRKRFLKFAFRHATAVLGTGEPALTIMERMGCPKEILVNFPCFIEPTNFSYRRNWFDGSKPMVFVSSGRLAPEKKYAQCIEALAQVAQRTHLPFRYRVMGTGPEIESLKKLAESSGIGDRVEFLGWVQPAESREVFESGDVFLHPAEFEPWGVVVTEAMAASMVVIASDTTYAALDRVTDGENGFLYRTNDIDHLREKIELVMAHPEIIKPMAMKARAKAEEWPLSRAQNIIKTLVST